MVVDLWFVRCSRDPAADGGCGPGSVSARDRCGVCCEVRSQVLLLSGSTRRQLHSFTVTDHSPQSTTTTHHPTPAATPPSRHGRRAGQDRTSLQVSGDRGQRPSSAACRHDEELSHQSALGSTSGPHVGQLVTGEQGCTTATATTSSSATVSDHRAG